jgi:hypothetical protein
MIDAPATVVVVLAAGAVTRPVTRTIPKVGFEEDA